jgi:uncharacterized membrane protein
MLSWRAILGVLALGAVLVATIAPVPAQDPAVRVAVPQTAAAPHGTGDAGAVRGMISVEGKEIPLPAGEWRLAGRAVSAADASAPQRTVVSVALVRLHGVTVDAAVLVQTNRMDTEAAWGKASACERTDLYFARVRYASDHDGSCAYAAYVDAAVKYDAIDPAWKQALLHGAGLGWHFPTRWVEAAYRITDPRDAIQVRYLFDPTGVPGAALPGGTRRSIVAWTEGSWYAVGSGFRNRLDGEAGLPDWRQGETGAMLPAVGAETSQVEHLGTKMITYRIFGTMTDMSVNYLWLGSLPSAGGLAVVGAVASSALYFVHELVWSRFEKPPVLVWPDWKAGVGTARVAGEVGTRLGVRVLGWALN